MAPVQNAIVVSVSAADRQVELDEKALSAPALCLHEKTRKQIVDDLLLGLQEQLRSKKIAEIYKETHGQLRAFLRPFFKSEQDVQEILSDVYIALLEGKSGEGYLRRAAKLKAINRQKRLTVEAQLFERLDTLHVGRDAESGALEECAESMSACDFSSPHADDQDPLEILIRREESSSFEGELAQARGIAENDRRFWWIRQKKWGKQLSIGALQEPALSTK